MSEHWCVAFSDWAQLEAAAALPLEALLETASVHPSTEGFTPPLFRLYATGPASLAAEGEIDDFTLPRLQGASATTVKTVELLRQQRLRTEAAT